ncbi:hypothetical protein C8R44DRAFT_752745 [Mycena epipterygia]|nr:hypothetical protein C8R44DRAFT_752745 [Mycena epipterygia]
MSGPGSLFTEDLDVPNSARFHLQLDYTLSHCEIAKKKLTARCVRSESGERDYTVHFASQKRSSDFPTKIRPALPQIIGGPIVPQIIKMKSTDQQPNGGDHREQGSTLLQIRVHNRSKWTEYNPRERVEMSALRKGMRRKHHECDGNAFAVLVNHHYEEEETAVADPKSAVQDNLILMDHDRVGGELAIIAQSVDLNIGSKAALLQRGLLGSGRRFWGVCGPFYFALRRKGPRGSEGANVNSMESMTGRVAIITRPLWATMVLGAGHQRTYCYIGEMPCDGLDARDRLSWEISWVGLHSVGNLQDERVVLAGNSLLSWGVVMGGSGFGLAASESEAPRMEEESASGGQSGRWRRWEKRKERQKRATCT